MVKESYNIIDIMILVLVLAAFLPTTTSTLATFLYYDSGEFNSLIEKSAPRTTGELNPIQRKLTTDDIMLMLLIADENTPDPKKLNIKLAGESEVLLNLDSTFINDKVQGLSDAFSSYSSRKDIQLVYRTVLTDTGYWEALDR